MSFIKSILSKAGIKIDDNKKNNNKPKEESQRPSTPYTAVGRVIVPTSSLSNSQLKKIKEENKQRYEAYRASDKYVAPRTISANEIDFKDRPYISKGRLIVNNPYYHEPVEKEPAKRGVLDRIFGLLGYSGIVEGLYNLGDNDKDSTFLSGLGEGFKYMNPFEDDVSGRHSFSDVLKQAGWKDKDPDKLSLGDVGRGAVGFLGDVLLDPSTYIPTGALAKILKGTGMTTDVASKLVSTGKVEDIIMKIDDNAFTAVPRKLSQLGLLDLDTAYDIISNGPVGKKYNDLIKGAEKVGDAASIRKYKGEMRNRVQDLVRDYNGKIMKLRDGGEDFTVGFNHLPFASRIKIGDRTLDSFKKTIMTSDQLRQLGDNTIAPYYNDLAQKLRTTRIAKLFSNNNALEGFAKDNGVKKGASLFHLRSLLNGDERLLQDLEDLNFADEIKDFMEYKTPWQRAKFMDAIETGEFKKYGEISDRLLRRYNKSFYSKVEDIIFDEASDIDELVKTYGEEDAHKILDSYKLLTESMRLDNPATFENVVDALEKNGVFDKTRVSKFIKENNLSDDKRLRWFVKKHPNNFKTDIDIKKLFTPFYNKESEKFREMRKGIFKDSILDFDDDMYDEFIKDLSETLDFDAAKYAPTDSSANFNSLDQIKFLKKYKDVLDLPEDLDLTALASNYIKKMSLPLEDDAIKKYYALKDRNFLLTMFDDHKNLVTLNDKKPKYLKADDYFVKDEPIKIEKNSKGLLKDGTNVIGDFEKLNAKRFANESDVINNPEFRPTTIRNAITYDLNGNEYKTYETMVWDETKGKYVFDGINSSLSEDVADKAGLAKDETYKILNINGEDIPVSVTYYKIYGDENNVVVSEVVPLDKLYRERFSHLGKNYIEDDIYSSVEKDKLDDFYNNFNKYLENIDEFEDEFLKNRELFNYFRVDKKADRNSPLGLLLNNTNKNLDPFYIVNNLKDINNANDIYNLLSKPEARLAPNELNDINDYIKYNKKFSQKDVKYARAIMDRMTEAGKKEVESGFLTDKAFKGLDQTYLRHIPSAETEAILKELKEVTTDTWNPEVLGYLPKFDKSRASDKTINQINRAAKEKVLEDDLSKVYLSRALGSNRLLFGSEAQNFITRNLSKIYNGPKSVGRNESVVVSYQDIIKSFMKKAKADDPNNFMKVTEAFKKELIKLGDKNFDVTFKPNIPMQVLNNKQTKFLEQKFNLTPRVMSNETLKFTNIKSREQKAQLQSEFLNLYDRFLNIWKLNNTAVNPGFHIQNAVSNAFQSFLGISEDAFDPNKLKKAYTIFTNPDPHQKIILGGEEYTYKELNEIATHYRVIDKMFHSYEFKTDRPKGMLPLPPSLDITDTENFLPYKWATKIGTKIEGTQRMNMFMSALDQGQSFKEAADTVNKFLFDYSDLTEFEQDVVKRIIPFYTFMKNNIPMELEQMLEHPQTFKTIERAFDNIQEMNGNYVEDEDRNEWRQDHIQFPTQIRGENYGISNQLPYTQIERVLSANKLLGQTAPLIKAPLELASGKYAYTGIDIDSPTEYVANSSFATKIPTMSGKYKDDTQAQLYVLGQLLGFPIGKI